jgi:transposase
MEKTVPELMAEISPEDWEKVPASVFNLIQELVRRMDRLEKEVTELRAENVLLKEQLARTSANSSQPPSKNPIGFKPSRKKGSGKPRGGQLGHEGHERKLYPLEMCQEVIKHHPPKQCRRCGGVLELEENAVPYRHQVVEVPEVKPIVIEHQFYSAVCSCCGIENQACDMSKIVSQSGYGPRTAAYVGLLSSQYRQSYRQIQRLMEAVFGIRLSVGAINHLRTEVSSSVREALEEAKNYIQQQPSVGMDETGFKQRNGDGENGEKKSGWLWVVVTPLIVYFQVILSRSQEAAKSILGEGFGGLLTSDRCPSYNWVDSLKRQLCWAHLKRDFTQISERPGASAKTGASLLKQEKQVFNLWHQFKNGDITRAELALSVQPIQDRVSAILRQMSKIGIGPKEKTPLAKTVRTCRNLLELESALWLFIREEGVEPTNNASERALRPAVIWRRTSFGSDSAAGSEFVSGLMTVVSSLTLQERNVLDFLVESISAKRAGGQTPSLLQRSP